MKFEILNCLLPQTTFKIWGIPEGTFQKINIFEYPSRDNEIFQDTKSMIILNELISQIYGIHDIEIITKAKNIVTHNGTFDQQIINLKHHFPNLKMKGEVDLIDYSGLGHGLLGIKDIRFGVEFFRALRRSLKLSKKQDIRKLYSLIYPWQEILVQPTNFFWEVQSLDFQNIRYFSKLFIKKNLQLFPELVELKNNINPTIITPPDYQTFDEFKNWVRIHEHNLTNFLSNIFYIKLHRNHIDKFPDTFKVLDYKFSTMNSPLVRVLPLEIILLDLEEISVISSPSSIVAKLENIFLVKNSVQGDFLTTERERKDYGLLLKRMAETNKIMYFN